MCRGHMWLVPGVVLEPGPRAPSSVSPHHTSHVVGELRGPGGNASAVCRAGSEVLGTVHTYSFSVKVQGQRSSPMFVLCLAHFLFGIDPGSEEGEGKNRLSCDPQVVTV